MRIELALGAKPGFARIRVCDNGPGLPAGLEAAVFEPWFTTKPPGRGTGLGLVVVRRLVEEAGGRVTVESRAGVGCTFAVDLPLAAPTARPTEATA